MKIMEENLSGSTCGHKEQRKIPLDRPPITNEIRIRSFVFMLIYVFSTLIYAIPSVMTFLFPFNTRYRFITLWTRFNLWTLKVICNLRYEVSGKEHIPNSAAIVMCKHQSAWETLALQMILPPQVWLLKRELLWLPFFGWGLAMLEPIAIDRRAGRKAIAQLLEQGAERLQAGRWIVIFPEGTRVPPGEHRPFRSGAAKLAAHTAYPVVPVAHNAGYFWPRNSFIKYPGVIRISIGPVIDSTGLTATEINQRAEKWIEKTTAEVAENAYANLTEV